jgi:uncharacterized protein (TIGR01777 family)
MVDRAQLEAVAPDAIVNLAGETLAQRWTEERKRRIRDSRVRGTRALAEAVAALPRKPEVFVGGSAVGFYGAHRGDEVLVEESAPGADFLARTASEWEKSTAPASDAGVRVALSRTGLVIGADGGVIAPMLLPFRLGLGGPIASGQQWMSWIALSDMVRAIRFLIDTAAMHGPVNLVAPHPVRNAEFVKALGRALKRPAFLPLPRIAVEILFGEMGENTLLASQRVEPKRLAGAGFEFRHPRLDDALRSELRR